MEPSGRTGLWTRSARFPDGLKVEDGVLEIGTSRLQAPKQRISTRNEKVINRPTLQIYYF